MEQSVQSTTCSRSYIGACFFFTEAMQKRKNSGWITGSGNQDSGGGERAQRMERQLDGDKRHLLAFRHRHVRPMDGRAAGHCWEEIVFASPHDKDQD